MYISLVIFLISSGLSTLPFNNNIAEPQLTDKENNKIVSFNSSSPAVLNSNNAHIQVEKKENSVSPANTGNANSTMKATLSRTAYGRGMDML